MVEAEDTVGAADEGNRALVLALAALAVGMGEVLIALANLRGRDGSSGASVCYWLGIVTIYVPISYAAWRLRRRSEPLVFLAQLLSVGVYLARFLQSPTQLATVDELQTLRSLHDLDRSHHLFAVNPIVAAYPRFPGSQIAIVAIHQLTGLQLAAAGKILIGAERLLLVLALFGLFRLLLGSPFAAYVGVLVYATNSSFVFFDSEVAYEAFALPLAVAAIYLLALASQSTGRSARLLSGCGLLVGAVTCVSHHMTSYWMITLLLCWSVLALLRRRWQLLTGPVSAPWLPTLALTALGVAWFVLVARAQVGHELGPVFRGSANAITSALQGAAPVKRPFTATGTEAAADSRWLRFDGYAAVAVSLVLLLAGLTRLRRPGTRSPLSVTLLLLGAIYPLGLALRLTQASTETSRRTVEFAFVGVALAAGWLFAAPRLRGTARTPGRAFGLVLSVGLAILATGDIVVGVAPYDRFGGPYLVDADTRSVTTPGQQAARWAAENWPAGVSFTATDATTGLLVAAEGRFTPKGGAVDGVPVGYIFDSPAFDDQALHIIQVDKIRYLVVDDRVTTTVSPRLRWPIPDAVPPFTQFAATLPASYLDKLASVPQLQREYDSGVVRIYRSSELVR